MQTNDGKWRGESAWPPADASGYTSELLPVRSTATTDRLGVIIPRVGVSVLASASRSRTGLDASRADVGRADPVLAQPVVERAREAELPELRRVVDGLAAERRRPATWTTDEVPPPDAIRCGSVAAAV